MTEKTEIRAGNTTESLRPKTVGAIIEEAKVLSGFSELPMKKWPPDLPMDSGGQTAYFGANAAPQDSLNSPDIDECAPLINAGPDLGWHDSSNVNKAEEEQPYLPMKYAHVCGHGHSAEPAPQIPEEIPPTNLWSLRWRINQLEERVEHLEDRLGRLVANSPWKA